LLKANGYETVAFVTQHFFFDRHGRPRPAYSRGFDLFEIQGHTHRDQFDRPQCVASEISDAAIAWLKGHDRASKFFMWLHYFDPHEPYSPPPEHRLFTASDKRDEVVDYRTILERAAADGRIGNWQHGGHLFNQERVAHLRALYDGEIHYVDAQLGRVFKSLKDMGLVERSLVVFTSDHGERLGEHDRWAHCDTLHGWEINVPLLISDRGKSLNTVRRARFPASTLDIVPTVLAHVNIPHDPKMYEGTHLAAASDDRWMVGGWRRSIFIQGARWKAYFPSERRRDELYSVVDDASEERDVAAEHQDIVGIMRHALQQYRTHALRVAKQSRRVHEELRAIGYIQ
jgi:arylsulfatase A-like enzyme